MDLEVIIPLRNPPAVLEQSIASLAAQTDRSFTVTISDNFSTQGRELIARALEQLRSAGLTARRIQPPAELGRVEHWNWAHHAATGLWVKPLFAGDWLEPDYVARVQAARAGNPECRYIFTNCALHLGAAPPVSSGNPLHGRFTPAAAMRGHVLRYGMQFGPPSAAAYERDAFIAAGGYPTALPICADSLLFCTLAASFGAVGLGEPLCHFHIHGARFSTTLPGKWRDTLRETFTYYGLLANHAWTDHAAFPWIGFARLLVRALRAHRPVR